MGRRSKCKKKVFKFTAVNTAARAKMDEKMAKACEPGDLRDHGDHQHDHGDHEQHGHCVHHHDHGHGSSDHHDHCCDPAHSEVDSVEDSDESEDCDSKMANHGGPGKAEARKEPFVDLGNGKHLSITELKRQFALSLATSDGTLSCDLEDNVNIPIACKCDLPFGEHGKTHCLNAKLCDLCFLTDIRNCGRPLNDKISGFCFKIPSLSDGKRMKDPQSDVDYPVLEPEVSEEGSDDKNLKVSLIKFTMNGTLSDEAGAVGSPTLAGAAGLDPAVTGTSDEDGDDEGSDISEDSSDEDDEDDDEDSCEEHEHKPSCRMCCMHSERADGAKLRGMKDWRPIGLPYHDQQFILRQAKKYHIDSTTSRLLQFVLLTLKKSGEGGDGMAPKQVPKFARKKVTKRKTFTRQDFPKFDLPNHAAEFMMRPYAYLELLDHNKDDGILLISLAEMIGISKMKDDMICVFEKNFGFDCRMEQFKTDEKKRHHHGKK